MKKLIYALCFAMAFFLDQSIAAPAVNDGDHLDTFTVSVGTSARSYTLYAPGGLTAGAPLLIAFHPSSSSGEKMRKMSGATLERLARKYGFAIAYPDGFEGHFNDCRSKASYSARTMNIDDVGFTRAIIDDVAARYKIERERVYALGYSNGAQMALRLAMQTPDLVAGVVAISANVPTPENNDCKVVDGRPVSVVLIEGTKDKLNPYAGGNVSIFGMGDRGTVMSAQDSAQWFAKRYGIAAQKDAPQPLKIDGLTATWQDWGSGQPKVRLITIDGGGHVIPQTDYALPSLLFGSTFKSDVPLESAWEAISAKSSSAQ
jgi:polyhydroxybutyrate depolymerase